MGPYLFGHSILIGLFGCAALQSFWLWWHSRRERIFLVFAAHCAFLAVFSASLIAIATATTISEIQAALDARITFGLLLVVTNVWLLVLLPGLRAGWFVLFIAIAALYLIGINFAVGPITGKVIGLDRFQLPWGEEIGYPVRGPASTWAWPGYIIVLSVQLFGLFAATRLWQRDRVGGILLALASCGMLVTLMAGARIALFRWAVAYLGVEAHAAWVILIALVVAREYRRRGDELAASEQRYRLIVENQTEFVVKWLPDGTRTFANESYCRYFGLSEKECIGTSFFPVVSTETWDRFMQALNSLSPASPEANGEQLCTVAGGEQRWQEWTRRGTFDAQGKLVEVLSTGRDITKRKRVEEELRQSEERFRGAFEFAAIGMALVSTDGRWLRVNESLCDLLGYGEKELLALDFQSITHPDDLRKDLDYVRQMLEGSIDHYQMEKRYLNKQGMSVWIHLAVSLLRDRKGDPVYFISRVQDISERKNAEQTLREYTKRLKALSREILETQESERRRLARELHDEIGQMLTMVTLRLHQLKPSCDEQQHAAIDEDIAFVNRTIEQVREMSLNLRPPMLDVLGLEATLRWYAESQKQRTGLDVQIVGHLEGIRSDPELEITCFRLVQEAVTNVLRHARAKHVWIELRQEETELNLIVRDDGVGFDVAEMQQRAGEGRSFGILAMRERIDLLGGRMEIESAPNRGTRICAHFPRTEALASTEAIP